MANPFRPNFSVKSSTTKPPDCRLLAEIEKITTISPRDIVGMDVRDYVSGASDKSCGDVAPTGAFYLIELDGVLAGMSGLRALGAGIAEMKR